MKARFNQAPPQRHLLNGHPLTRKLLIVTVIKVAGLVVLWWLFFSGGKHVTPEQAAQAMLHPPMLQPQADSQINHTPIGNSTK